MSGSDENIFTEYAQKKQGKGPSKGMGIAIIVLIVVVLLGGMLKPFAMVGPGSRGVVLWLNEVEDRVLEPGFHFLVPGVERVIEIDATIQKIETDALAASADIQETRSRIALNYHIDPSKANVIFQTYLNDHRRRVIDPAVQEAVKAVTARYSATKLITERDKVREDIKALLKDRLGRSNLIVDDFAIIDFQFSEQFAKAIESKQTAEQLALKAERDLERIKIEATQKIESAKAEAESLRLQKQNISKDLIELRKIEAQMKAIEKWDGVMPRVTGGALPFVDAAQYSK